MINIEDILKNKRSFGEDQDATIGLAYPIHGGDAPEIIYDFVKYLPIGKMNNMFILNTAGDFIHFNDACAKMIIKQLSKKQYHVNYERTIAMGSNSFYAYNERLTKQLYLVAKDKVRHMRDELLDEKKRLRPAGPILKAVAAFVHWGETLGARAYGRGLKSTTACTLCGKCVRECPVGNIRNDDGKILFSWDCILCMRCVYSCPEKAIKARFMRFTVLKKGHNINAIVGNNDIKADFIDEHTKGFFKHFYRYISDINI
jgi:ferredoxin